MPPAFHQILLNAVVRWVPDPFLYGGAHLDAGAGAEHRRLDEGRVRHHDLVLVAAQEAVEEGEIPPEQVHLVHQFGQ